ncbi:hypothetical protein ABZP36_008819 [Zizania latifolia]
MATGHGFGGSISHDGISKSYGGEAFKGSEDQVCHQSAPLNPPAAATNVFVAPASNIGADTGSTEYGNSKMKKGRCFRCKEKDHTVSDCMVILCDIYEALGHTALIYSLLLAPKPTASMCGWGVDGGGFFMILTTTPGVMKPREHNRTGIIQVERGHISVDNLIIELRRLVPVRFQWDVKEIAPDTFMVQFPSVIELDRLHRVRSVPSFDFDVNLVIDKWEQEIEAKFVLKKT